MAFRVSVRRWRARGAVLAMLVALAACAGGGQPMRALRVAVAESGGDITFSLEEPVRAITCVERDFRRSPTDPQAVRPMWSARCTSDCRTAVRYDDSTLDAVRPAVPLAPSVEGACYECELTGERGRAVTRFRVPARGRFAACRPRVGDL
jgi:hypothetical protein